MTKNLKIQETLLLGFGAVLVLMLIMASIGVYQVGVIDSAVEDMMNDRYPKVVLGNQVIKQTLDNGRLIRNAILSKDKTEAEAIISKLEENRRANALALEKIQKLLSTDGGRSAFAHVLEAREKLSSSYEKIYVLIRSQNHDESVSFLKAEFAPSNNAYIKAVEDLNKLMSDFMDKGKEDTLKSISTVKSSMLVAVVVAVALGVLVAVALARSISRQIEVVVRNSEKIAQGDFSREHGAEHPSSRTEIGRLLIAQEGMRNGLIAVLEKIRDSANQVNDSARELASVSEQVAISVQRQADSTSAASATLEELSVSIDHVSDNAIDASNQASCAGGLAREGAATVNDSVLRIQSVHESADQTHGEMAQLQDEVVKIGNIVTVIREVADQTNLLALNAAIEAARAGETGRGFAVVADEVRKLAERTTTSAQEITQMVLSIQKNAHRVVSSMEGNQRNVATMTESSDKTSDVILNVQNSAEQVLGAVANINTALGEQRIATQELAQTMETVAQMAEANSATVEELATTSRVLMDLAGDMQTAVSRFRW